MDGNIKKTSYIILKMILFHVFLAVLTILAILREAFYLSFNDSLLHTPVCIW